MNAAENVEMNIDLQNNARQNAAIQAFRNRMQSIPNSERVVNVMIVDWIDGVGPEDINQLTWEHIREEVERMYQDLGENPPGFTEDNYKDILNHFTTFILEFHGQQPIQGGKRSTLKKNKLWPLKYYRGLSKTKKNQRKKEIKHFTRYHWKDPRAYKGFKTDKGVKTKSSGYTQQWYKKFPNAKSLQAKSEATGVPVRFLEESYNRGMAAWRTGHRPGATEQQWGYARVHSLLMCGKTHYTTDSDIVRRAKESSKRAREWFNQQCK